MDSEFEAFKTRISLAAFTESLGYQRDRKESTRNSWVMRCESDKIIVATDQDGHGIYFSVRDDQDNGTIIDFIQRRTRLSFGEIRKELRKWTGDSSPYRPKDKEATKPERSSKDRQAVIASYAKTRSAPSHPYLLAQRRLLTQTLADTRFVQVIRSDSKNNAIFPHFDRQGLCGYEIKNNGFTGFARGGSKGLWYSANLASAQQVIVVESAIDALSHAQTFGGDAAYASIGGSLSDLQRDLLQGLVNKANARGAVVLAGTDADEQGDSYAKELLLMGASSRLRPEKKDWNAII